jgi:protein SCO1/2
MRYPFLTILAALVLMGGLSAAAANSAALPLPAPGTYKLNHIQRVPFAIVIEGNLLPRRLAAYTRDKVTLLSFFYSHCTDAQGCPLAWDAFESVRETIKARPDLHGKTRLVFVSLDPARDRPDMLRLFAQAYAPDAAIVPWHFLTTYSYRFLAALLRDMGSEVAIDPAASRPESPVLNHLLKAYLIDREGWVREIYSNATLDPATLLGDIETLLIEDGKSGD